MRLIEVEAFKEKFIKEHELYFNPAEARAVHCIFDALDNTPTAYDVEKVVSDVEEYANSKICWKHTDCPYRDKPEVYCENCGALGALEIVRKGGV